MDSRESDRVLIVGGGIAGPALALCLAKRGRRSLVVEKAGASRDAGYKVDIRGVAVEVLDQLGLYDQARQANCNVEEVAIVDGALHEVAAFDANYFFGRALRDLELMRGDLSRLLREHADDTRSSIDGDSGSAAGANETTASK